MWLITVNYGNLELNHNKKTQYLTEIKQNQTKVNNLNKLAAQICLKKWKYVDCLIERSEAVSPPLCFQTAAAGNTTSAFSKHKRASLLSGHAWAPYQSGRRRGWQATWWSFCSCAHRRCHSRKIRTSAGRKIRGKKGKKQTQIYFLSLFKEQPYPIWLLVWLV